MVDGTDSSESVFDHLTTINMEWTALHQVKVCLASATGGSTSCD